MDAIWQREFYPLISSLAFLKLFYCLSAMTHKIAGRRPDVQNVKGHFLTPK
jgi:hypothetical protein